MGKGLTLTKEDLEELEKEKKRNKKQRMDFVDMYSEWLKKTPNKVWSKQQAKYLK
jgi:predicted nucleic acid-binding protein